MKICTECNTLKALDQFYTYPVKGKKYHQSKCKTCFNKRYSKAKNIGVRKAIIPKEYTCFRCGIKFIEKSRQTRKYCSPKCKYEGISDRMQLMNDLKIPTKRRYVGFTY